MSVLRREGIVRDGDGGPELVEDGLQAHQWYDPEERRFIVDLPDVDDE